MKSSFEGHFHNYNNDVMKHTIYCYVEMSNMFFPYDKECLAHMKTNDKQKQNIIHNN